MFIAILKCFVKVNDKKILVMSFGGRKYDDSPKEVYEALKKDPFFADYDIVWGFLAPEKFKHLGLKTVKVDTFKFYIYALSSRIWINNSSVERGLNLRRSNTIEFNTWHGTPIKKLGDDINTQMAYRRKKRKIGTVRYCSQSEYDREIFSRLFKTDISNIIISDLPRNDNLAHTANSEIDDIGLKLNIPKDKKIILYAPTFREYSRDALNNCVLYPPIDFKKWKKELGNEYVLLFRAHYEVVKALDIKNDSFIMDVSDWPQLSELIKISDILISDYSSIYFDYAITEKPMFNFSYDYEEYLEKRGTYIDLRKELPCKVNLNEDTLIEEIKTFNYEEYCKKTIKFKEKYAPYAGQATYKVIE